MYNSILTAMAATATYGPSLYYGSGILHGLITPSYIKKSSANMGVPLQQWYPEVFVKVTTLRDDILLYSNSTIPFAAALGTNFGKDAIVLINPLLGKTQGEAKNFILKHEISHIRTSDGFVSCSLSVTLSLISTFAVPRLASVLPWWGKPIAYYVPVMVGMTVNILAMQVFERRADAFALQHATDQELLDVKIFIEAHIDVNKEIHKKYPNMATAEGNLPYQLSPSEEPLTCRVQNVIDELNGRNVSIPTDESALFENYRAFHKHLVVTKSGLKLDETNL